MKKNIFLLAMILLSIFNASAQTKFVTNTGQAVIFSHTSAEDISAKNNTVSGAINTATGDVAISMPVQSFQFEKALMQEHFNNVNFMDSRQFPRITLKGKIINLANIDFSKNGDYEVTVSGDLTIRGISKPVTEKASIEVRNDKILVTTKFIVKNIGLYGVGKPKGKMKNNVADDIAVTYAATYEKDTN